MSYANCLPIEGQNVTLRRLTEGDLAALERLAQHAPNLRELKGAAAAPDGLAALAAQDGFCAIVERESGAVVGALCVAECAELNEVTLGYALLDEYKGRGYTKEAVKLLSDRLLKEESLPYLVFVAEAGDASAQRLVEKCGFTLYERRVAVGHRLEGISGEAYSYFRKY